MAHYYDEKQDSPLNPFLLRIKLPDVAFTLYSGSGVFSLRRLDKGTEVLLRYCKLPSQGSLLDLGCGYGVVGIAAKMRNPELSVVASDVSERALALTRMNVKHLDLDIKVVKSDVYTRVGSFDTILVNPPYVAGRKLIFEMIENAPEHLNTQGTLQLVARHQKGGKQLESKMQEVFGNVEVLGKKAGYRVYCSTKTAA